jgi:hypothetical protein
LSIDFEENLNFYVADDNFIDVGVDELNDILRTSRHTEVDEDDEIDDLQFSEEDDDIDKKNINLIFQVKFVS